MTNTSFALGESNHLDTLSSTSYPYLPDIQYYHGVLSNEQNRKEIASRYDIDFEDLTSVEYSNLSFVGLLNRTRLYRVTFRDFEKRNLPLELLLKVAHLGFRTTDISRRHHVELGESMMYQHDQIRFWNAASLPAPLVFDLNCVDHQGVVHYYLAMEFWDGNTHDLNVLALNQYARNTSQDKKNQQLFVDSEKDNIVTSSLGAMRKFHVIGTKEARTKGMHVFVPEDLNRYFIEDRGRLYFERYLKLKSAQGMGLNGVEETLNSFCRILLPILEPLFDTQRNLYSQGDEYLHHFQYRQSSNGHKLTGIFDSDHVMMMRPEYSFAKLLTSHLLDLDFNNELTYVESTFFSPNAPQGERYNRLISGKDVIRDYILISLATRLFDIGKRASHALREDYINTRIVTGVTFKPHKIEFPLKEYVPPSVKYPSVKDSIAVQTRALQDRLTMIERGEFNDILHPQDRENIKGLQQFLIRNNLL